MKRKWGEWKLQINGIYCGVNMMVILQARSHCLREKMAREL